LGSREEVSGDKRALYRRALDRYVDQALAIASAALRESLRRARRSNSELEMAPHDPELQRVVAEVLVRVEGFFGDARQLAKRLERFQRREPPRIWLAPC
jgi:hypothetical protein